MSKTELDECDEVMKVIKAQGGNWNGLSLEKRLLMGRLMTSLGHRDYNEWFLDRWLWLDTK